MEKKIRLSDSECEFPLPDLMDQSMLFTQDEFLSIKDLTEDDFRFFDEDQNHGQEDKKEPNRYVEQLQWFLETHGSYLHWESWPALALTCKGLYGFFDKLSIRSGQFMKETRWLWEKYLSDECMSCRDKRVRDLNFQAPEVRAFNDTRHQPNPRTDQAHAHITHAQFHKRLLELKPVKAASFLNTFQHYEGTFIFFSRVL